MMLVTGNNFVAGRRLIQKLSQHVEKESHNITTYGHLSAFLDPLGIEQPVQVTSEELPVVASKFLNQPYGIELGTVPPEERAWLVNRINQLDLSVEKEGIREMAKLMIESETFDAFMQKRFGQVKRYGLEGLESLVVAVSHLINLTKLDSSVVFGMAHRGRLNLLKGPLGMDPRAIFAKLKGKSEFASGSADVLSHLGINHVHNQRRLIMLPNSSHLEAVNPVQLRFIHGLKQADVLGVQIHGDGAMSGQGVVQESLQLSRIPGFEVGGVVHIVTNNQLGFTADKLRGRSGRYCTDVAHVINSPVLHVNGDHPECVVKMIAVASEYRSAFRKDVFVDIVGFRKWGHNELDEPSFTQPQMYARIRNRPLPGSVFASKHHSEEEIEAWRSQEFDALDSALKECESFTFPLPITSEFKVQDTKSESLSEAKLKEICIKSVTLPQGFDVNARLAKFHIDHRKQMAESGKVDWATAEALAFGSLVEDGFKVRLVGQDCIRGTFSHRHAGFFDQSTNEPHFPLGTNYQVISSPLSELAVMGFEYGRSLSDVNTLHVWEAQFGDFFNGAQVLIDAFVSSGEQKWGVKSNLTLLLPHGYDGAGPEHSSCMMERFLQLCDAPISGTQRSVEESNMMVVNPTTPANYFHLMRTQMQRQKPLVVVAPKTLLRLAAATSSLTELSTGRFQPVIATGNKQKRALLVSGKFYYELAARFPESYIVRLEQLNPLPLDDLTRVLEGCEELVWVQEEPENMGAFAFVEPRICRSIKEMRYVGRAAAAAPATGIPSEHKRQLEEIFSSLSQK